jgi:hypothetical protein
MEELDVLAKQLSAVSDKVYTIEYPQHHPRGVVCILYGNPKIPKELETFAIQFEYSDLEKCKSYLKHKLLSWHELLEEEE